MTMYIASICGLLYIYMIEFVWLISWRIYLSWDRK